MNDGLTDLYQEVILDHSRHPRNFGPAEEANRQARGNNPLCGDRVSVYLAVKDDHITDARFEARGCAISIASASMMTEMIKGKSVDEAKSLFDRFHTLVTSDANGAADDDLAELESLSGVRAFPTRIKCATLAWHAMTAALDGADEDVKTE
ncbi:MAG: SUF system NifU family Fe-S cluster assembly protein [Rhodospirillaceae bacterium]|jgi:nitrogen fixation NifU-like protein|nr:SUF system NifU family Fe-S cluster assembly protein [Rhodospirillaceae bacterium]